MDAEIVALIGTGATLIGTLGGASVAPWLGERMRRTSTRKEQIQQQRLAIYGDLLRVVARLVDNARERSAIPQVDLPETGDEEFDRLIGQARVLVGDKVDKCLADLSALVSEFNRLLINDVAPYHQRLHDEGVGDEATALQKRSQLGGLVDDIVAAYDRLRGSIRKEMKP